MADRTGNEGIRRVAIDERTILVRFEELRLEKDPKIRPSKSEK